MMHVAFALLALFAVTEADIFPTKQQTLRGNVERELKNTNSDDDEGKGDIPIPLNGGPDKSDDGQEPGSYGGPDTGGENSDVGGLEYALNGRNFQGDIVADYEDILNQFGQEEADKLSKIGVIPKPDNETKARILSAHPDSSRRWPRSGGKAIVPYSFASGQFTSTQQSTIINAMADLESKSGVVDFVPRTTQSNYIEYRSDQNGCWSQIGRRGGKQTLHLQRPGCVYKSVVQHELIHALGFYHEQSRSDRDAYVDILYDNVIAGKSHNFDRADSSLTQSTNYDYASIMHYSPYAFGKKVVSCTNSVQVCNNAVVAIQFKGTGQDGSSPKCLDIPNGYYHRYNGQKLQLYTCGAANWRNQLFWLDRHNSESVVFRYAYDTSWCIDVNHNFGSVPSNGQSLQLYKCDTAPSSSGRFSAYENQRFVLEGNDLDNVKIHWESDVDFCVDRHSPNTYSSSSNGQKVQIYSCGAAGSRNQVWDLRFFTIPGKTFPCQQFPAWCSISSSRKKTINAQGHSIGFNALTSNDLLGIKLMYKCPSSRNLWNFCSPDCPCGLGEGDCDTDSDCAGSLKCIQKTGVDTCGYQFITITGLTTFPIG